jgi:hypothetical protein
MLKHKLATGAAAVVVAAGLAVLGAAPAQAITRMGCAPQTLNLVSADTTCWGYTGYQTVTLYGVYYVIAGDNDGRLQGSSNTTYFYRWGSQSITQQTIASVQIY